MRPRSRTSEILKTILFIAEHPLTRDHPWRALARLFKWQVTSRCKQEVLIPWIGGSKLAVRRGMTGATGNIYCGLHEFPEMAFLLHLLRPNDLFVDVGANIGSYTVLASAVAGAETVALEPDPHTTRFLRRNIEVNDIDHRVTIFETAVGDRPGVARFTVGLDTINRIANDESTETRVVRVRTMDDLMDGLEPVMIKLDVEGHEANVVAGAKETLNKPSLVAIQTEDSSWEVVEPLINAGFERVHYDPLERKLLGQPRFNESNALFVRNRTLVERRIREACPFTALTIGL